MFPLKVTLPFPLSVMSLLDKKIAPPPELAMFPLNSTLPLSLSVMALPHP